MPLYLVIAPSVPVVSLDDMKSHLKEELSSDDNDALIEAYTAAATARLDGRDGLLNRALIGQTWDLKLERFPYWCGSGGMGWQAPFDHQQYSWNVSGNGIRLPLPPLIDVTSVKYIDTQGVEQTFDPANYHVVGAGGGQPARLQLRGGKSWPSSIALDWPEPITIRMVAGYVDVSETPPAGAVPTPIVQAIKLIVGHLYANRESVVIGQTAVEVPQSAKWLLEPYMVYL